MRSSGRRASLAAALFLIPAAAAAQTAPAGSSTTLPAIPAAPADSKPVTVEAIVQGLLDQHHFDEADHVLDQADAQAPGDPEVKFLRGMVALARGDNKRAIRIFRAALIDHPDATRIRLELARAFYLDGDYANATRQFRFALAGNPPKGVVAAINHYLYLIREEKSWSYSFDVSLAPDTNLNAGPGTRDITIYGLPFELSDDARKQSGVGLSLDGSAEYAPSIGKDTRLRMGVQAGQLLYTQPEYDDTNATVYIGPRFVRGRWDFSVLATGFARRYGGDPYNGAVGGRLEATYYPSGKTAISASFAAQRARYAQDIGRNGGSYTFSGSVIHTLNAVSGFVIKGGVARQSAVDPALANTAYYAAAGYFRDLPGGFTIYAEPSIALARYDGLFQAFGVTRSDTGYTGTLTLLNRHIVLSRFTPKLSYSYTHQNSNIALYQYRRSRVEIGLTTSF